MQIIHPGWSPFVLGHTSTSQGHHSAREMFPHISQAHEAVEHKANFATLFNMRSNSGGPCWRKT